MSELMTINTDDYGTMAKLTGIVDDGQTSKKTDSLNRLRIWHQPVMGQAEVNGRLTNVETVEGGMFRLEIIEGETSKFVYSKNITMRPFMQRFMYRRYIANKNPKPNEKKGSFHKTIMADSLKIDLKDNTGRFNCGKPSGYIEDFKALPVDMQNLIRDIKRVRVVFGVVTMVNPVDRNGKELDEVITPFIWEIDNKDAFKALGDQFAVFARQERVPLNHNIVFSDNIKNDLPNGSSYFTPQCKADLSVVHEIKPEDKELLGSFLAWVKNFNDYICKEWDEKAAERQEESIHVISEDEAELVEDFIEIESEVAE